MRITGMATGLDMDEIIKNSMKPYRIKVDQMTQKKDVVEIKQKLYRDIIKDSRDFFDKHLDIAKSDSLLKELNWATVSFSSSDEDSVTAKASGGAIKDNYTVSVEQLAKPASTVILDSDLKIRNSLEIEIEVDGEPKKIKVDRATGKIDADGKEIQRTDKELVEEFNSELSSVGMTAKYSTISGGAVIETKKTGENQSFKLADKEGNFTTDSIEGTNLQATIKGSNSIQPYKVNSAENTVAVDGITFNFNKECTDVNITGKTDSKELKDKIVAFVNDYNKLIEKLNATVTTKHDRSYNPLTADQKKDMSETEVKLWNERVEKGQLYRDSDVTRIANTMKDSMRTLMESSGLKLESIGIKPVKDYSGNLNGTFTIDEDKLTTALENNTEDVMKLFITQSPTKEELAGLTTEEEKIKRKSQIGILNKLKDTIDIEFRKSTSSPLLKKAGFEGTSTFSTNELNDNITNYEKKIKDMEKDFSRREQALYSKYATFETMMNKLNSQQSNLMSQLGMS